MQGSKRHLQATFPAGASPVIEPPVPPLLEPCFPQPISRDTGRHIPFCELLHELVVRLGRCSLASPTPLQPVFSRYQGWDGIL